jgi:hypothetical protein
MTAKQAAPFGSWSTPITTTLVTSSAITLAELAATSSSLVWVESRPEEAGRSALVYQSLEKGSKPEEVTPEQKWNVRTRVHEYGGAAFALAGADIVFSTVEGPVYKVSRQESGSWSEPVQVTPGESILAGHPPVRPRLTHPLSILHSQRRPPFRQLPPPPNLSLPPPFRRRGPHQRHSFHRRQHSRPPRHRRRRAQGAPRCQRRRLLLYPSMVPLRQVPQLDPVGPPRHAVGGQRALDRRGQPRRGWTGRC